MDVAKENVENFLDGTACSPHATQIVEEVLFNHALKHTLVYASRELKKLLESHGHSVTLQYCESPAHGHPVPFLVARDARGSFVVPNELEIQTAAGAVDVVVIDGSMQPTKIERQKPELTVHKGGHSTVNGLTFGAHSRKRRSHTARKGSPSAIVIMPAHNKMGKV